MGRYCRNPFQCDISKLRGQGVPIADVELDHKDPLGVFGQNSVDLDDGLFVGVFAGPADHPAAPEGVVEGHHPSLLHQDQTLLVVVHVSALVGVDEGEIVGPRLSGVDEALQGIRSLSELYSVDFSQSRKGIKKWVINKRTIKVFVSCF